MIVENATIFSGNPYHKLIYSALKGRYEPNKGTAQSAKLNIKNKLGNILHIHWEENTLRKCETITEAKIIGNRLAESVEEFVSDGGRVVWTIHNELPHELEFVDELLELRARLGSSADKILIHNLKAMDIVREQVRPKTSKIHLLPHPTYHGVYEGESRPIRPDTNTYLFFGMLRAYKGLDFLIEAIESSPALSNKINLRIRGNTIASDPYAETVINYATHEFVDLQIGRVADIDVAQHFKTCRAAIIPYERFLTSGVALLAMTLATPLIAPDSPQMRELLPVSSHQLLFKQGSRVSLREKIQLVESLSIEDIIGLSDEMAKRGLEFAPQKVSLQLGRVFDNLPN